MVTRRATFTQPDESFDDTSNDTMESEATTSSGQECKVRKKLTSDDECTFISIVLKYYDEIEGKATVKNQNPKQLQERIDKIWQTIREEFYEQTMVRNV